MSHWIAIPTTVSSFFSSLPADADCFLARNADGALPRDVALKRRLRRLARTGLALAALVLSSMAIPPTAAAEPPPDYSLVDTMGFPQSTYYRVTRLDMRLCPAPFCGGVFVERVNRRAAMCADGTWGKECHAAIVDFSELGLSADEEARLQAEFVDQRVLARGRLVLADSSVGIEVPTLVVTDAWRGVTGTQPDWGRYWGVVPSGIACITHPCPVLLSFKLNGRRVRWLHDIDLSRSGATPEQINHGFDELWSGPGLIAFGKLRRITGPAGKGKELRASEFFTKVKEGDGGPRACGGFTFPPNPTCDTGQFCELPAGTCNIADLPGTCQTIPEACIEIYDPVCGCDGVTYSNDCHRQQAQVALDHPGACRVVFPPEVCGDVICADGTTCCNPVMGLCTPPGLVCIQ